MQGPSAILECGGLKVACGDLAETLPLEASDHIRICVPLGEDPVALSIGLGDAASWRHLRADEVGIVRPRRACGLSSHAPTPVAVMWLDAEYFIQAARASMGAPMALPDDFVAPDRYLRRMGNVLKAGVRVGRPPQADYLECLARDLALHVASAYAAPSKRSRARGLAPDRLARSLQLIEERLADPLRVEDLAARVNMSAFHYARMFKCSTGHSPHFYITMRRIERAKEMLASTSMPLAKLSESLGYATQAHFTGVFRVHAGTTPHAYRMRFRAQLPPASHIP